MKRLQGEIKNNFLAFPLGSMAEPISRAGKIWSLSGHLSVPEAAAPICLVSLQPDHFSFSATFLISQDARVMRSLSCLGLTHYATVPIYRENW